jgi:hypothetical protein
MRHVALTLAVVSLTAGAAPAEDAAVPPRPQTIRVLLHNQDTLQGYLRGRSKDEVVIYTSEGRYRHVPLADVQRLEVRSRIGTHARRGALIGVLVWGGVVAAASRGSLDKWGVASWQSGAILAGSVGLGAVIGSQVPRYGWRPTEPAKLGAGAAPGLKVSFRF